MFAAEGTYTAEQDVENSAHFAVFGDHGQHFGDESVAHEEVARLAELRLLHELLCAGVEDLAEDRLLFLLLLILLLPLLPRGRVRDLAGVGSDGFAA